MSDASLEFHIGILGLYVPVTAIFDLLTVNVPKKRVAEVAFKTPGAVRAT